MYDPAPDVIGLFAASKAIDKLIGKEKLDAGSHLIDQQITLRLTGGLEKEKPLNFEQMASFAQGTFLALLCSRAKLSRADAKRLIGECAAAAIGFGDEIPTKAGFGDRIRDAEEAIAAAVEAAPKVPKQKAGATKWLGTCAIEKAH